MQISPGLFSNERAPAPLTVSAAAVIKSPPQRGHALVKRSRPA